MTIYRPNYSVSWSGKLSLKDYYIILESSPPLIGIILFIVGFIVIF